MHASAGLKGLWPVTRRGRGEPPKNTNQSPTRRFLGYKAQLPHRRQTNGGSYSDGSPFSDTPCATEATAVPSALHPAALPEALQLGRFRLRDIHCTRIPSNAALTCETLSPATDVSHASPPAIHGRSSVHSRRSHGGYAAPLSHAKGPELCHTYLGLPRRVPTVNLRSRWSRVARSCARTDPRGETSYSTTCNVSICQYFE